MLFLLESLFILYFGDKIPQGSFSKICFEYMAMWVITEVPLFWVIAYTTYNCVMKWDDVNFNHNLQ